NGNLSADSPFFVDLAAVSETCNDGLDNDRDGQIDNGCLPIHFSVVGEGGSCPPPNTTCIPGDAYTTYYRLHGETDYIPLENSVGFIVRGAKEFDYSTLSGLYDFKIEFLSSYGYPYNNTPMYSTLNIAITGISQTVVDVNSVTASGQSYGGHNNHCAYTAPPATNAVTCTLVTPMCSNGPLWLSIVTTCEAPYYTENHGRAEFNVFVHSPSDRMIVITSPAADATFSNMYGQPTIPISVLTTSLYSITKVDFYYKDSAGTTKLIGTDTTSPYSFAGDLPGYANLAEGNYDIIAKFTDSKGEVTSAPVKIIVQSTSGTIN
ncbi:MAG: Ig-like domain-containing protein, partial [Candidatus Parcubacteria bacterium]|nr:Ig-like domain-containing protein [Candidatus Parcubacteria bacterium]